MPADFVPDICSGTNIFECLFNLRSCKLKEDLNLDNPLEDVSAPFDGAFGTLIDLQVELDLADACILAAITSAFAIAGEPLPTLPPPDPPLDFSGVESDLTDMVTELGTEEGYLGFLDGFFTLENDGSKITRIISA